MPDETPTGKRLHLERLVARGMVSMGADDDQVTIDLARDLVHRVLQMHVPLFPTFRLVVLPMLFIVACFAFVVGFFFGLAA